MLINKYKLISYKALLWLTFPFWTTWLEGYIILSLPWPTPSVQRTFEWVLNKGSALLAMICVFAAFGGFQAKSMKKVSSMQHGHLWKMCIMTEHLWGTCIYERGSYACSNLFLEFLTSFMMLQTFSWCPSFMVHFIPQTFHEALRREHSLPVPYRYHCIFHNRPFIDRN
jgi:hypothetical protein